MLQRLLQGYNITVDECNKHIESVNFADGTTKQIFSDSLLKYGKELTPEQQKEVNTIAYCLIFKDGEEKFMKEGYTEELYNIYYSKLNNSYCVLL